MDFVDPECRDIIKCDSSFYWLVFYVFSVSYCIRRFGGFACWLQSFVVTGHDVGDARQFAVIVPR
jgi:hypothetical protein